MTAKYETKPLWIPLVGMAAVIASSNFLVQFPINEWLTIAAFTYPLAFYVTDLTNRWAGPKDARKIAYAGLVIGLIISAIIAPMRIALASSTAFICSQLLDILVFNKLRGRIWWQAPLLGSILASILDTFIFFSLAFAGTGLNWLTLAGGDLVAKLFMAAFLLLPYRLSLGRLSPKPQS
ncbi:MAG: VUT family protein [Opitutales bacterium]